MLPRFAYVVVRTPPMPGRIIPHKLVKDLFCLGFGFSHPDFMQTCLGFAVY